MGVLRVTPELIWMADDRAAPPPGPRPSLELLTHLLAGAVAQDLPYHVVIVTLSRTSAQKIRVEEWDGAKFGPSTQAVPVPPLNVAKLHKLIPAILLGPGLIRRGRVFVVRTDDPLHLPSPTDVDFPFAADTVFDRAVLVTDAQQTDDMPAAVVSDLQQLLDPDVLPYGGIVPSLLVQPREPSSFWQRWFGLAGLLFGARDEPEDDQLIMPGSVGIRARLFRDACYLTVDGEALTARWGSWDAGGRLTAFVDEVSPRVQERVHRWGRAVTNRRVGVAVSGGGACAYRLIGLLRNLDVQHVPVDVVAGLSGGAVIGAYYCIGGAAGLDKAIKHGPIFGVLLPLATFSSWFIEKAIDFDLESARIEEADVRYVAVTAELPSGHRPRARLVTRGTVGEAVRASSTLPPLFGPTKKNAARYTDGGAASLVPAEIVRNCGGDLTVSYNVIAGPTDGNPFSWMPFGIGDVLRDLPLLGRVIDLWVWYQFLWARASRQFGKGADVPIAFYQELQMMEAMLWIVAGTIAKNGENDPEVQQGASDAQAKWSTLMLTWP